MLRSLLTTLCVLSLAPFGLGDEAPFPGKQSEWHGFPRYEFEVDGKLLSVVAPHRKSPDARGSGMVSFSVTNRHRISPCWNVDFTLCI